MQTEKPGQKYVMASNNILLRIFILSCKLDCTNGGAVL